MAEEQLRVRLTATDDGLKATIDNSVRDIARVQDVTDRVARATAASMGQSRAAINDSTREIAGSVRTIGALLASGHITKLTGDYVNFGDVVSAIFAGRLVGSIAQFSAETLNSVTAANEQRRAMLATAEAATANHRAMSLQYAALVAAGEANTVYAQRLRVQVAASSAATIAARSQAASMGLLRGAYAALGGPVGMVTIAASALALWASFARSADDETKKLTKSTGELGAASDKLSSQVIAKRIVELQDMLGKITINPANAASSGAAAGIRRMIDSYQQVLKDDAELQDRIAKVLQSARPRQDAPGTTSVKAFADEYDTLRKAYEDHQTQLAGVNAALDEQYAKVTLSARAYYDFTLVQKGLNEEERAGALARWDNVQSLEELTKHATAAQAVLADLYPNEAAALKYQRDLMLITDHMSRLGASADEIVAVQTELGRRFAGTAQEAEASGGEIAQIYEDTASSIRGSFRDTFRDVFDEGSSGFSRFGDRILNIFKDVLADMATMAIARPIIVPIVAGMGSLLGVPGSAQAQVLQQLGGAGGGVGSALPLLGSIGAGLGAFGGGVGAGLAGGFGAASTAASGAAFSTGAGALSATGAFVGAALPWVAGALALNAVTGGGLFGTKWKTKDEGLDLAIAGGDITGQAFEIEKRKKSLFRGTSTRTNVSAIDSDLLSTLNAALDADTAQLLAGARGLGVGTAESILDGFASQTRLSLAGKSESEMQAAIQDWLDTTLGDMAKAILGDTRWRGLLRDASREMIESVFSIGSVLGADPVADSRRMMEIANRTYKQQLDEQRRSLLSLNAVYDGSVTLTQQLAAAAQEYYKTELAYLQQIASVRGDIGSQLGGSIESIRQSTMDPGELYAYLQNRSVALSQDLTGATDPARIQEIVREINATSGQAYGLIPQAEREAYAQQFIDFLTNVETTANQRLDGAQNQVAVLHRDMAQTVTSTMQAVSDRLESAARAQEAAAEALSKSAALMQSFAASRPNNGYYNYGNA